MDSFPHSAIGAGRRAGREVAEACLAYGVHSKVEAANPRSDLLNRRRILMQAWADYLWDDAWACESTHAPTLGIESDPEHCPEDRGLDLCPRSD